jgi:hypothetical protein
MLIIFDPDAPPIDTRILSDEEMLRRREERSRSSSPDSDGGDGRMAHRGKKDKDRLKKEAERKKAGGKRR